MTFQPTAPAYPKPSALVGLHTLAWIFTLVGGIALIVGIVQSQDAPSFLANAVEILEHAAKVNSTFTLAGGLLGAALFAWMIIMAVSAVLERLSQVPSTQPHATVDK
jgi:hypothetical protein